MKWLCYNDVVSEEAEEGALILARGNGYVIAYNKAP
jgi:ribose 5-phosphate isomerase RpiB